MNWLDHITSLSNPIELISLYAAHVFTAQIQIVFIDAILILTLHGYCILALTKVFKRLVIDSRLREKFGASFICYFIAIVLVVIAHCNDIFILSLILDSLQIFPDPLTTFYYVSGMYTTIGSSATPGPEWRGLSMIISFTGLFAFAISGSGLYSMLGLFLEISNKPDADS
jgi:hypothetical protein